jgi:hypothetical protein
VVFERRPQVGWKGTVGEENGPVGEWKLTGARMIRRISWGEGPVRDHEHV